MAARSAHGDGDLVASRSYLARGHGYAALATSGPEQVAALHRLSLVAREVGEPDLADAADTAAIDGALRHELPRAGAPATQPEVGTPVDLTSQVRLLEEAVRRALEPLLPGARLALTIAVVPEHVATLEPVACREGRAATTVPVRRPA